MIDDASESAPTGADVREGRSRDKRQRVCRVQRDAGK